jgi:AAA family ATP:ADP antiporter
MITAQFWAFANDIYDSEQGKRLMPLVGIGSSLGAWAGASAAGRLLSIWNTYQLMLVGALGLFVCMTLTIAVNRRENHAGNHSGAPKTERFLGSEGGFHLVLKNRYLFLIALLVLVLNIVNTTGEFILGKMVVDDVRHAVASGAVAEADMKKAIGQFYSSFFGSVNLLGFLLQLFVVSRLFKYVGVRGALFLLPAIALVGYSLIAVIPLLAIVQLGKTLENSVDYSVQSTARHALFLPTSREAKYKAQSAIDSFFWRAGDMLQGAIVLVGTAVALGVRGYAAINVTLIVFWLVVVAALYREHKKLEPATEAARR